mmetsp:Transcript_31042/g.68902  ORF Transcript_31042/g.68902 Transcript_31042/m.68902 type:complete len:226 (-) Transcript_31042:208-885(-)
MLRNLLLKLRSSTLRLSCHSCRFSSCTSKGSRGTAASSPPDMLFLWNSRARRSKKARSVDSVTSASSAAARRSSVKATRTGLRTSLATATSMKRWKEKRSGTLYTSKAACKPRFHSEHRAPHMSLPEYCTKKRQRLHMEAGMARSPSRLNRPLNSSARAAACSSVMPSWERARAEAACLARHLARLAVSGGALPPGASSAASVDSSWPSRLNSPPSLMASPASHT